MGAARAKEIFLTNQPLTARECLAIGAVSQVHPDAELEARARELVEALAEGATAGPARTTARPGGAAGRPLEAQLEIEHRGMVASGATADAEEGVKAFSAKRSPMFIGR